MKKFNKSLYYAIEPVWLLASLGIIFIYGVQDTLRFQPLPNLPILFIAFSAYISYRSNSLTGSFCSFIFVFYYMLHYLVENYNYSNDKAEVSLVIVLAFWFFNHISTKRNRLIRKQEVAIDLLTKELSTLRGKIEEDFESVPDQIKKQVNIDNTTTLE